LKSCELISGDFVISMMGTVGKCMIIPEKFEPGIMDSHLIRLRLNYKIVDKGLLLQLFASKIITDQIAKLSVGGIMEGLSSSIIKKIDIPLSKIIEEQSTITKVLSETDEFIQSLDKLIKKKKLIKQGAMQELLTGKKRLPNFNRPWENKQVHTFANVTAGGTPSTFIPEYWSGEIRWMNSGELNLKKIYDVEGRITDLGLMNSATQLLPEKCVLIGLAGQGKTRGTVAMNYVKLCTNQSIAAILPNESFVPEFLYFNLDSRYNELRQLSTGEGGRGGLNLTIIRHIPIAIPPNKEEQGAIAKVLADMDLEIEALERKRDKCRLLKVGLMQQLLTGRIRLKCPS
jgi:type I restriction enzyme S subunit